MKRIIIIEENSVGAHNVGHISNELFLGCVLTNYYYWLNEI